MSGTLFFVWVLGIILNAIVYLPELDLGLGQMIFLTFLWPLFLPATLIKVGKVLPNLWRPKALLIPFRELGRLFFKIYRLDKLQGWSKNRKLRAKAEASLPGARALKE